MEGLILNCIKLLRIRMVEGAVGAKFWFLTGKLGLRGAKEPILRLVLEESVISLLSQMKVNSNGPLCLQS